MNRACVVLWLDLKGTSAAIVKEPQVLSERLERFYGLCEHLTVDLKLPQSRAMVFSDSYFLTSFSVGDDHIKELLRFANVLIDKCQAQELVPRAFLTTGIESVQVPGPAIMAGGDLTDIRFQKLFGVNTALISAQVGESAHLPGVLLLDELTWKRLGSPEGEQFIVNSEGFAFRPEMQGPSFLFTRLR